MLLAFAAIALWVTVAADRPPPGFLVAAALLVRSAPSFLTTAWQICADLLVLAAIVLLVAAAWKRRLDVVRDSVVAAALTWAVGWTAHHPSQRVALSTAVLVTMAPHLTRPVRRVGRWLVALGCLGVTVLSTVPLLGGVAGVLLGTAAAAATHLLFGSCAGRPAIDDVRRALEQVGVVARSLSPADRQPAGLFEVTGIDEHGGPLVVKVYGRDAHDSALASTLWRSLWYREPGAPLRLGRLQQVEHEAFVTLLASQSGIPTEPVVTAGATADDDAVLVLRRRGELLLHAAPSTPRPWLAPHVWAMLSRLHNSGIAHGTVDETTLLLDGDEVGLVDFGGAAVGASTGRQRQDRAQALVTLSRLDGIDAAVASAESALGAEELAEVLPYLQRPALTARQRQQVKDDHLDLDALRSAAAAAAGVEEPAVLQLRRVTIGTVLRIALPALAIFALSTAIAGLDFEGVLDELIHATWWLVIVGFLLANATRVTQAISTIGASPAPLPFGPVYALQLAMSYIQVAIPSYAARVAVSVRFFQRRGVPSGAALTAGFVDVMTTFFIEVIGITSLLMFTPATLDLELSGASNAAKRLLWLALALIAIVVLVLAAARKLRRALIDWTKRLGTEALTVLRGFRSPRRLALLLGGNLGTELCFTLALGVFARALGTTVPFADLLLIHLSVSLLAGLLPIPGGVGVAEALLTYGLIRSGMPDGPAFAAVLCYRASTFYLPPTWGFFSLRWLERNQHL